MTRNESINDITITSIVLRLSTEVHTVIHDMASYVTTSLDYSFRIFNIEIKWNGHLFRSHEMRNFNQQELIGTV